MPGFEPRTSDSNHGPLVSEATALLPEPQQLQSPFLALVSLPILDFLADTLFLFFCRA